MNVLVVDDERRVLKFVSTALSRAAMQVECASSIDEMQRFLERMSFDVLILDRMLGRDDSLRAVSSIKKSYPKMKILFLSALREVEQKALGLERGADDYLDKPFHVPELVARVRSLTRRDNASQGPDQRLHLHDLEIDLGTQAVSRTGKPISLTAKEFKLLLLFVRHPHKIFSREDLLDRVWGLNADPGSNVVEVAMNRLRVKIDGDAPTPLIHTKRGSGYWCGVLTTDE